MNASTFTPSQREALYWYARGKLVVEVGIIMHRSPSAIKAHLANARRILNASTTTYAVVVALKKGLLKLEEL